MSINSKRLRRAAKNRARIRNSGRCRLTIHRTPRHIYAQINSVDGATTLISASTVNSDLRKSLRNTGNIEAASAVGKLLAEKAIESGIDNVAFDRSGFQYHGRVKALADAARESGLKF